MLKHANMNHGHFFSWLFILKYYSDILRVFCLKVEKIKFDPKILCNILLCKSMFRQPPPKYVMF
jgi:hypothetical protein